MSGPSLGTNLGGIVDWSTAFPFVDLFKMSRVWFTQRDGTFDTGEAKMLDLDDLGWVRSFTSDGSPPPFQRVSTVLNTSGGDHLRDGNYVIDWHGEGTLVVNGATVVSRSDNQIVLDPGTGTVGISIIDTDPQKTGNYIRDIRFYHEDDRALLDAGVVFNPDFIERIEDFRVLRFMDWMGTNNSKIASWSDAPANGAAQYSLSSGVGGASIEVMVQLANEVKADPWFNIPHGADDAYVRALATYVKEHLDPNLIARFEFSNEVWNWGFQQAHYANEQAKARWGEVSGGWMQWYGVRAAEVANVVADVFGSEEIGTRALNVFSTQAGWRGLERYALEAPAHTANGGTPPSDAPFHVYAIAPYFGGALGSETMKSQVNTWIAQGEAGIRSALDHIVTGAENDSLANIGATVAYHSKVAKSLGWQLEAYEGGQHIVDQAGLFGGVEDPARTAFFIELTQHPEMGDFYRTYLEAWRDAGGGLMAQFSDFGPPTRYGSWGIWDSVTGPDTPRSIAIEEFRDTVPAWWEDDRPASVFETIDRSEEALPPPSGSEEALPPPTGTEGEDRLFGTGSDLLVGGAGNDTYVLSTPGDTILELENGGTDLVQAAFSFTLGSHLENLTLTGHLAIDGIGNSEDNVIIGNEANNFLYGLGGDDTLIGGAGDDTLEGGTGDDQLQGGAGNDRLDGGPGDDTLTGGEGADYFIFSGGGHDVVTDFENGRDTLILEQTMLGSSPLTVSEVISAYARVEGNDVVLDFWWNDSSIRLKDMRVPEHLLNDVNIV